MNTAPPLAHGGSGLAETSGRSTTPVRAIIPRAAFSALSSSSSNSSSSSRLPPVQTLGMGALARVIGRVATQGSRPTASWLHSYSEATRHRLHHLRPRQLSTMIRAIVALEHHPGEEWLNDFDTTCFSHPGPFDSRSAVEVLASMTALPDLNYLFPQHVYLKVLSGPDRFDSYQDLACLLHCLGAHNVPSHLWDESHFLDVVGNRMGQVLAAMSLEEARRQVDLTLSKSRTIAAVLQLDEADELLSC